MAFWKILNDSRVVKLVEALTPWFTGKPQDALIQFGDELADAAYQRAYDDIEVLYAFRADIQSNAGASMVGTTSGQSVQTVLNNLGGTYATDAELASAIATREPTISAGTTAQYWRGDKSWQLLNTSVVTEGTNQYFTETRVLATPLTGYAVGANAALAASDTILAALGKVQGQLNNKQASGTYVTSLTVAAANGISGSFTGGATPQLSLTLGAITPTSITLNGGPVLTDEAGDLRIASRWRSNSTNMILSANGTTWVTQPRIFVGGADPGAMAADGDIWIP